MSDLLADRQAVLAGQHLVDDELAAVVEGPVGDRALAYRAGRGANPHHLDDDGYTDAWCYHGLAEVLVDLALWDGEDDPPGRWHRNISSGRRREFDAEGNLVREEVRR